MHDILYREAQPKAVLGQIAHCMLICRRGHTTHIYSQVVVHVPEHTKGLTHSNIALVNKTMMSCTQHSYQTPLSHVNFRMKPTKFGSNKEKLHSYIQTLEYICM